MVDDGVKDSYAGEWWLAGNDRRVGGELTIGPAILLRTVRTLQSATDDDDSSYATVLGERLSELVRDAGIPFLAYCGPDPSTWIGKVKDYRNVVAHADDVNDEDQAVVVRLTQTLQVLLRMTLLRELGFTEDQRGKMTTRVPHWKHLREVLPHEVKDLFVPSGSPSPDVPVQQSTSGSS